MPQKKKPRAILTDEQINDATCEMLARHAVQMSEHVSSVQILATKLEPDGRTNRFAFGKGDLCARAKMAELWLEQVEDVL